MLTRSIVRDHIKVQAGDDALIDLYCKAAIQAAERYTGRKLAPGMVTDMFQNVSGAGYKLSAEPSGQVVATIHPDDGSPAFNRIATVASGAAYLPGLTCGISFVEMRYPTGTAVENPPADLLMDTDPLIEMGVLKFVTYAYAHRGDDPNSWAADSGAASLWRGFRSVTF